MKRHARTLLALLAASALLAWIAVLQMPDGRLHVIFLDVEDGQGILIRTPSGRQAIIDGGSRSSVLMAALGRHLPFWQRTLHATIATHQGSNALLPLIDAAQRYQVSQALGPLPGSTPTAAYQRWRAVLDERRVPFNEARPGMEMDLGDGVRLSVVSAGAESVALRLIYGETRLLLPGTQVITAVAADPVVAMPAKLASFTLPRVLDGTEALVLFTGKKQSAPPAAPTLSGARLFSTAAVGSVELVSDGRQMVLRPVR